MKYTKREATIRIIMVIWVNTTAIIYISWYFWSVHANNDILYSNRWHPSYLRRVNIQTIILKTREHTVICLWDNVNAHVRCFPLNGMHLTPYGLC